jgi:hypothetical protein
MYRANKTSYVILSLMVLDISSRYTEKTTKNLFSFQLSNLCFGFPMLLLLSYFHLSQSLEMERMITIRRLGWNFALYAWGTTKE